MDDRQPTYPGRIVLKDVVTGEEKVYDMTMADKPTNPGTPPTKANLLQDFTCDLLELPYTATVNDAFVTLLIPPGKFVVKLTVLTPGGRPVSNITVEGMTTLSGQNVVTNENGQAFGYLVGSPATVTLVSNRADLKTVQRSITAVTGVINTVTVSFDRVSETSLTFSTSGAVWFSPDVSEFDCSAIGGGQDGSTGSVNYNSQPSLVEVLGGKGGNAGQIANAAAIKNPETPIQILVASANSGRSSVGSYISAVSSNGAAGGDGAFAKSFATKDGMPGGNSSGFLYPPTNVGGAGGGGAARYDYADETGYHGAGGSPGGGSGAQYNSLGAKDGSLPGSGGGGGDSKYSGSSPKYRPGGKGKPGLCGVVWRYKE